jgi:hypothetical protein
MSYAVVAQTTDSTAKPKIVEPASTPAAPAKAAEPTNKLSFYGDARFRPEYDWNVLGSNGVAVDPRSRFRLRLRLGFNYQYSHELSFGARLRTGNVNDQQTANVTLGGNEVGALPIGLDRAFIKYSAHGLTAWAGKNSFPFYTHDELFISQDIAPEGVFASYEVKVAEGFKLKPSGGFFVINSSGKSFVKDRTLKALQLAGNYKFDGNELNFSTGLFVMDSLGNAPDNTQSFLVNYSESFSNVKFTYNKLSVPVSIGGNYMVNMADLGYSTSITANNLQGQKAGYSVTAEIGKLKAKNDYLLAITYTHIEKYSILDYLSQDDWMRWGFPNGASGARASNFQGVELKAAYAFGPNCNLMARTYIVKGIVGATPTATIETGNRFRLDFNVGF